ncbi:sperm acrosome-associated protein 7-like [Molossus molossus]|uniref:Sperm acrosome associated 7 n=1 Tax=Molossus molossus TaxID=27622 RepID=A0A7J8GLV1_MOLMO|nr:sperm acrosome-associated protein 7-like [Molossus molossus]KAF6460569.1 hypothetical protein HJG59_011481 [Molossus molossus]
MAVNRGVTVFVLLLYCCHRAEQLAHNFSDPVTAKPSNSKILEDMSGLFDEILVQEILDPHKSTLLETQRPLEKSMKNTKKKTHMKMNNQAGHDKPHGQKFSSGNEDRLFLNEEEKEMLYQIKSLTSLEKIIDSLQRTLVNNLKQRRKKYKSLFKASKHHRLKENLN